MTFKSTREYRQLSKKAFLWDSLPFDHMNFNGRVISKYGRDYFNERYNYITGNYYNKIKREQLDTVDKMINLSNANMQENDVAPLNRQHVSDMIVPEEYKEIWKNTIPLRYYEDYKDRKHLLDSYLKTLSPEQQAYAIKTMCLNNESKNYLAFLDLQEREMTEEQKIIFQSLSNFYKNEYNKEQLSKEELAKKSLESIENSIKNELTNENVTNFLYENDVKSGDLDYAKMIEKNQEEMDFFKTKTIEDDNLMFEPSNLNSDALKLREQFKQIESNYMKNRNVSNLAMPLDDESLEKPLFEASKLYFSQNNQDPAFYNPNLNARMNVNEKRDLFTNQFLGKNNFKQMFNPNQSLNSPSANFVPPPVTPNTTYQSPNQHSPIKEAYMQRDPYLNLDKNIFNSTNVYNQKQTFNPSSHIGSVPQNYNSITNQYNQVPNQLNAVQNENKNFANNFANAYQNNPGNVNAFNQLPQNQFNQQPNAVQNENQNFANNFANAYQNPINRTNQWPNNANPSLQQNAFNNQPNQLNAVQNENQNFANNFANAYQNNPGNVNAFNQLPQNQFNQQPNAVQNENQNFANNFANAYQNPMNQANQWSNNANVPLQNAFNNQPMQQPVGNVFNQPNYQQVPNNANVHPLDGAPLIKLSDILKRRKQPEQQVNPSADNAQAQNTIGAGINNSQIPQNNVQLNSFDETPSAYNKFNYAFKEFIKQPNVYNIVDLIHAREVMEMSNREIVDQIVNSTIQVNNQYAKSVTKYPNAWSNNDINQATRVNNVQATTSMVNANPNQTISLSAIKNQNRTNVANPFVTPTTPQVTNQFTQVQNAYNNALIVNQPNNRQNSPFNLSNPVRDSIAVNLKSLTANALNKNRNKSENNQSAKQPNNLSPQTMQPQQPMANANIQQPLFKQPQFQPYTQPIDYLGLKNTNQWGTLQQPQSQNPQRLSAFNKNYDFNLDDNKSLTVRKNKSASSAAASSRNKTTSVKKVSEPTTNTAKMNKAKVKKATSNSTAKTKQTSSLKVQSTSKRSKVNTSKASSTKKKVLVGKSR